MTFFTPEHAELGGRALALPVWPIAATQRPGSSPCATAGPLGAFERLLLQQAVTVVALQLMRQRDRCATPSGGWPATCSPRRLPGGSTQADLETPRLAPFGIESEAFR